MAAVATCLLAARAVVKRAPLDVFQPLGILIADFEKPVQASTVHMCVLYNEVAPQEVEGGCLGTPAGPDYCKPALILYAWLTAVETLGRL